MCPNCLARNGEILYGATKLAEIDLFMKTAARHKRFKPDELEKIRLAFHLAKAGHFGQFRDNGASYFEHVRDSTSILIDELGIFDADLACACLLHDTVEDSSRLIPPDLILITFGTRVYGLVIEVSKPPRSLVKDDAKRHQRYFEQIRNASVDGKLLKVGADRLHNCRTLFQCQRDKRGRKIAETEKVYLPLLGDVADKYPVQAAYLRSQFNQTLKWLKTGLSA